jgi:pyruvate dehydrogenase E1 component alpha subunit
VVNDLAWMKIRSLKGHYISISTEEIMAPKTPAKKRAGNKAASTLAADTNVLLRMYRNVYATRQFELKCVELYRQGHIRGYYHPYLGEEAIAAGSCAALEEEDYIVSTHRGHGHCISKGADLKLMMAEITGRATGYCKGRGGSMHISSKTENNLGANGIVAAGIPIGCGAGMGIKVKGGSQVVIVFFSDGASNQGVFGESMNFAAVFELPVIFLLENNHYAVSTPVEYSAGCCELSNIGPAYGVPGICVDGNDALAVYLETSRAVERARKGEGPSLIEANTYRHGGHHVNDPGLYMDKDLLAEYKARDPIYIMREKLTESEAKKIEEKVDAELQAAVDFAMNSPQPSVEDFLAEIED